jgi:UDP-N-acetylglucosamine--N-acetylmuramyl-(pentapeptide) pyrophosphoryl-undecaprenol N-acetylglucosamine transferase
MKTRKKKIFITGGHLTPALAVIEEIRSRNASIEIVFIGREYAIEGSDKKAYEQDEVVARGVRFIPFRTGRLQRIFTFHTVISLIKIPIGFFHAILLCWQEKPDCIVSFGGYIALPIVIASFFFGIPVLTHEQTRVPGLANKIISLFARRICLSFPDIAHTFSKEKSVYTGLPVRKALFESIDGPVISGDFFRYPILYITGGITGAASMNDLLLPIISTLLDKYTVIHQTGRISYDKAITVRSSFEENIQTRYIVRDYIDERSLSWILHNAALVISRAGANTVTELALLHKKVIFIPLPWSGGGEQLENAKWFMSVGVGVIIEQKAVDKKTILHEIEHISTEKPRCNQVQEIRINGAKYVVDEIEKLLLKRL